MSKAISGIAQFTRPVINKNGYTMTSYPSVGDPSELLQDAPIDVLAESVTQLFPLGTKITQGERVWRYCKNAATALTIVGTPIQSAASVHSDCDEDVVVAASTGEAYAIGSYDITLVSTTNIAAAPWSTENGGKDGYVFVNGGTGIGQMRKIKAHEAFASTNNIKITCYDPWNVAIVNGNSECGIIQNPYSNVVLSGADVTNQMPVGVNPIAVTASYYFWAQSGGPAAAVCNTTIAYGTWAVTGTTAGKIDPGAATTTEYIIGYMITAGIKSNDHAAIFLILDS